MKALPGLDDVISRANFPEGPVLFTGGTGFVGRWMVESFRKAGGVAYVASRSGEIKCDIRKIDEEFFPEPPKVIVHLARRDHGDPDEMADTIINGTRSMLRLAARYDCRVLNVSSGAAGFSDTLYGRAKRTAELLCEASGLNCVTARVWTVYGPGMWLDRYALSEFIKCSIEGRPIEVKQRYVRRSYLYASDLTVWLYDVLARGESDNNVSAWSSWRMADVASMVAEYSTCSQVNLSPDLTLESYLSQRSEQSPFETVPLKEGIRRTMEWFR